MNDKRRNSAGRKIVLAIPAAIGWLTHRGLYEVLKKVVTRKTKGTVFYHSVFFILLLIAYPLVLIIVISFVVLLTQQPAFWILLLLLPFTAWCYKEFKAG